jgi:hypothetical protein
MFNKLAAFANCISSVSVSFQIRRLVGFEPNFQCQGVLLLDDSLLKQCTTVVKQCQPILIGLTQLLDGQPECINL